MMSNRKRLLVVLLAVLVASMGFAGGEQEKADEGKTITIWVGGQVAELDDTWKYVEEKYEEQTGNTVEVQLFGFDVYYDKLLTALAGGSGPDLAFADLG